MTQNANSELAEALKNLDKFSFWCDYVFQVGIWWQPRCLTTSWFSHVYHTFISSWCEAAKSQLLWQVLHVWPGWRSAASHATQCSRQQKLLVRLCAVQQVIQWMPNEPLQSGGSFNSFLNSVHFFPLQHLYRMLPLWAEDPHLLCEVRRSNFLQLP